MNKGKSSEPCQNIPDIVWSQLRALPAFRALVRAMEASLFLQWGPLPRPMLDIGCGDGHFAKSVWKQVEVGIDCNSSNLREAHKTAAYRFLCQATATCLPFADAAFACVVSNSVFEHIPDVNRAISEAYRVLQRGGQFILSVPTDRLNDGFAIVRILKKVGANQLSERYKSWFTRIQAHFHLYSALKWQQLIETAGFRVVWQTGYMSPRAAAFFDLGHFYGTPNLILHKLTGRWVIWPWRPRFALEEALLCALAAETDLTEAACHFFVSTKV
jgi:ubiquinone/menaquinone biosynthesis C-methylase UbiE